MIRAILALLVFSLSGCVLSNFNKDWLAEYPEARKAGCRDDQEVMAWDARLAAPQDRIPTAYAMVSCYGYNDLGYLRHMLVYVTKEGKVLRVDREDHLYDQLERINRKLSK